MSRYISSWTPERDAMLRTMWSDGVPTHDIAEMIGLSMRSVFGRRSYLKLEARGYKSAPRKRKKSQAKTSILHPKNGRFDSNAALHRLLERWVA